MTDNNSNKFDWIIASSNTYGYLIATVGPTLVDPLLTTHMAYGARNYKYAHLIWPIAAVVFILTLLIRKFASRTNVIANITPLLICSGISLPIFYPEVPHMNVFVVTIMWSIITSFWLLSRNYLPEFSRHKADEISHILSSMPPAVITNRLEFTRNLLFVIMAVTCVGMIAGFYLVAQFNKELVTVRKELFYLTLNTNTIMYSYIIFIVIGPVHELFMKYRMLSNAKLNLDCNGMTMPSTSYKEAHINQSTAKHFDIFISVKITDENKQHTEDFKLAQIVYSFLKEKGFNVFLSSRSIIELGEPDYMNAIENAIKSATVFIAVAVNPLNLEANYLQYEWKLFNHKIMNTKPYYPRMITYYDNSFTTDDFPARISVFECIKHDPIEGQSLIALHQMIITIIDKMQKSFSE